MQWDHLPRFQKVRDVSTFSNCTEEEILHEIAKCELVCTNCHTIRTFQRNGWGPWSVHDAEATNGETWAPTAV
jgi:hypothetical protein